ncbi:transcription initiation factor TFIID subunit 8 isoform X4 [Apteryx mantelli]|uniref:Transcription initiation factor TFIID subunit 8 n=1 Tax=Apteryx mantelli TaxID=2696672 RepID=A0ABM4FP52_9AVES
MADTASGGSGTRSGSKQPTTPADNYYLARRRTLQVVVSSLLTEAGFESAEKAAVETLTEMLQSSPVTNQPVTPKALTAGQNKPHPSHIPGHFPEFPDPHTYIKTPTYREPVSDYQVLREKAASQRRDVERALTRFMAKTGETQSLFKDDVSTFPLIAARPFTVPYLTALLPSELEMQQMEETDSSEQDDQTDTENLPLHMSTMCFLKKTHSGGAMIWVPGRGDFPDSRWCKNLCAAHEAEGCPWKLGQVVGEGRCKACLSLEA